MLLWKNASWVLALHQQQHRAIDSNPNMLLHTVLSQIIVQYALLVHLHVPIFFALRVRYTFIRNIASRNIIPYLTLVV